MQPIDSSKSESGSVSVKSARRVFEVLEYFDEHQQAATVIDVANKLGYPQSSTSALMRTMRDLGYLHYDGSERTYVPTARVALMGQWINNPYYRDGHLRALMQDLSQRTGETILLAARNGLYAQYVHVVQASVAMRLFVPNGTLRPLAQTAAGLMLLSSYSDAEVGRIVKRINADPSHSQGSLDPDTVLRAVQEVREQGYSFSLGLLRPSTGAVAMLLPVPPGAPPLVLTVAGVIEEVRINKERIVQMMRSLIYVHLSSDM